MKNTLYQKITCLLLVCCISAMPVCAPKCGQTAEAATKTELSSAVHTITRVYDTTDDGTLQYHYVNENGDVTRLNTSNPSASFSAPRLKRASNLPAAYDLRTQNLVTPIKNQGVTGCCWAFAVLKSLESNLIAQGISTAKNTDLSESHLTWYALHPSTNKNDTLYNEGVRLSNSNPAATYLSGGNALIGIFALARWSGAVSESSAPFSAASTAALNRMAKNMSKKSNSFRYKKNHILTDASCYDDATRNQIKEAILRNGVMDVSYYYNESYDTVAPNRETAYYQTRHTGKNAIDYANHSVAIIGWNDAYAKENFGAHTPSSDGAWLIANSYGTSYGQNGYCWISYEEPSLTEFYSLQGAKAKTYDNNYQYDAIGWGGGITSKLTFSISGANIYTANNDYTQLLKAVGIYTLADDQRYTIKIYRGVSSGKPTSGTLAATIHGTEAFQGYHTVTLPSDVFLKANEKFSVAITYYRTTDANGYFPIEGPDADYDSLNTHYTSKTGQSFIYIPTDLSKKGKWYDLKRYGTGILKNNLCIKAFTVNQDSAGTLRLSKTSVTLGKGETFLPKITAKNDGRAASVTFRSSKPNVVSVSKSGKIKAKKTGKATINASLATGKTAKLKVTVKKAPKKINLKPANTKKLLRRKSFRIKIKLPKGSASNRITYTSSNPKIAKVTAKGKVTGKKNGTAVITVSTYNRKKAKLKIYVT